jgi:hypothetical protein
MNLKPLILVLSLLSFLATGPAHAQSAADCLFDVDEPLSGMSVGRGVYVEGTASLPPGRHLWVLARHESFRARQVWFPQGEGMVDPATGRWKVFASIGESRDVPSEFELAVAVFDQKEHLGLSSRLDHDMETNEYRPMHMPPTLCAPVQRMVRKTSHN